MLCAFSRFSNRTSRRTWSATSRRFHRHFSPVSPALLKCFVSFRRLRRHFSTVSPSLLAASFRRTSQMLCALPSASPTLLAGFACSSRGFSNRTSRQFHRHFSNVYSLPGSSAAPFPPSWNIAAFNSASDKVPPAESAKSFSTLGRSDSFSAENLPR